MSTTKPENGSQPEGPSSEKEMKEKINKLYDLINQARKKPIVDSSDKDDDEEDDDGLKEYRGVIL